MKHKFSVGDRVRRRMHEENPQPECGVVVHFWYNDEMDGIDYYIAFFGTSFPKGKPDRIPYVLRYLETSLEKAE